MEEISDDYIRWKTCKTLIKNFRKRKVIRKLEVELTEEGLLKSVYIERYLFACSWIRDEEEEGKTKQRRYL